MVERYLFSCFFLAHVIGCLFVKYARVMYYNTLGVKYDFENLILVQNCTICMR